MDIFNQEDFKLIDLNCYYGCWPDRTMPLTETKKINDYLEKGFSHICLASTRALFLNSYSGNNEIYSFTSDNSNLLPVVVMPHHLEEIYDLKLFKDKWLKIFRTVSINNLVGHKWLSYIAEIEGNVIVPYSMGSYNSVSSLAKQHKKISFVLTSVNYPQLPEVLALLANLENVYIEISCFQLCNGIEYLCKNIGPEKILLGSNYPVYTPESVLLKFNEADISYKSKRMIGRGNIERLLGGNLL